LDVPVEIDSPAVATAKPASSPVGSPIKTLVSSHETLIGTWYSHSVDVPDGSKFTTGVSSTDPWWHVDGRWFGDGSSESVISPSEAVIGIDLARRLDLHAGDAVTVRASGIART